MAPPPGSKGGRGSKAQRRSTRAAGGKPAGGPRRPPSAKTGAPPKKGALTTPPQPASVARGPFRLGAVDGTTPGKWIDIWQKRMPEAPLELMSLPRDRQRDALMAAAVDAALVRLPIETDGLHVIPLYDEVPVVVCAADSHLTAAEELSIADLAGETLIVPADAVLDVEVPDAVAPRFAAPDTTEEAIATVAAGVGVVIVPMSLARLHHRKDADFRPLVDGPLSTVALAWPSADASAHVDAFVGIVRGRTENSSRG